MIKNFEVRKHFGRGPVFEYAVGCQCFQCKRWAVTLTKTPGAVFKMLRRKNWREVAGMALCDRCSQGGKIGVVIQVHADPMPRMYAQIRSVRWK